MLVGGVTTLKRQTSERQYGDAAMLLQVSEKAHEKMLTWFTILSVRFYQFRAFCKY
jgi:hypothetical protein